MLVDPVEQRMIVATTEVTLLADGSKYSQTEIVKKAPLTDLARIGVRPRIPDTGRGHIEDIGVELILAGEDEITRGLSGQGGEWR
jgi:DeoR/GlpR family transcriptional regulator of sugar metabolism